MNTDRLLDTKEAAEYLHVCEETVRRHVRKGALKAQKMIGGPKPRLRFRREDLDAFLSGGDEKSA